MYGKKYNKETGLKDIFRECSADPHTLNVFISSNVIKTRLRVSKDCRREESFNAEKGKGR